jgi:hypothetical protein
MAKWRGRGGFYASRYRQLAVKHHLLCFFFNTWYPVQRPINLNNTDPNIH